MSWKHGLALPWAANNINRSFIKITSLFTSSYYNKLTHNPTKAAISSTLIANVGKVTIFAPAGAVLR